MITSEIIGKRIKDFRDIKKISQQLMVDKLKEQGITISRETLSKIENGNRTISAVELKGICFVLDVSTEVLLEDNDEESLVTLFRKRKADEKTLKSVEDLQDMILSFMNQRKILGGKTNNEVTPLWRN